MTTRACEVIDIPWLLTLGQKMHAESRYGENHLNLTKVAQFLRNLINTPSGIVLRTDHGFLFGAVSQYWFGDDFYAVDYVLYVEPEHRKGGEAAELILAYISAAKVLGVAGKDIMLEHTTGTESELLDRLYTSLNFRKIGGYFILDEKE